MQDDSLWVKARYAVDEVLKAREFIDSYKGQIQAKLEASYRRAVDPAAGRGEVMFVAEALPMMGAIVHLATTPESFENASRWAQDQFPGANPASALAALTLIYIVDLGDSEVRAIGEPGRRGLWAGMRSTLSRLLESGQPAPT